jgi:hypothetical protein
VVFDLTWEIGAHVEALIQRPTLEAVTALVELSTVSGGGGGGQPVGHTAMCIAVGCTGFAGVLRRAETR